MPRTLRFIRGKSICRAAFHRRKYCLAPCLSLPFLSPLFLPIYPLSLSSISLVLPRLVRTLVRFYVPVNARLLSALDTHARGLLFTVDNGSPATMSAPTIFSYCKAGDCACKNEKSHERERERERACPADQVSRPPILIIDSYLLALSSRRRYTHERLAEGSPPQQVDK